MSNHGDNAGWITLERPGKWSPLKAEVEVVMSKPMRAGDEYSSAYLILRGKAFDWIESLKAKKATVMMRRGSPENIRLVLDDAGPFLIATSRGTSRIYLGPVVKWVGEPGKAVPAASFSISGSTMEVSMPSRILAPSVSRRSQNSHHRVEHRAPS